MYKGSKCTGNTRVGVYMDLVELEKKRQRLLEKLNRVTAIGKQLAVVAEKPSKEGLIGINIEINEIKKKLKEEEE